MNKENKDFIRELEFLVKNKEKMSAELFVYKLNALKDKINKTLLDDVFIKYNEFKILGEARKIINCEEK